MKSTTSAIATIFTLLTTTLAAPATLEGRNTVRTVRLTDEFSGAGQSADIAIGGPPLSLPTTYPDRYSPFFRVDRVEITGGVVQPALCNIVGKKWSDGNPVTVVSVNGDQNAKAFLKPPFDFDPYSLTIQCW